jgi:hypothetical protein
MSCLDTLPQSAAQGVVIPANIRDADRTALDQHLAEIRRLRKRAGGGQRLPRRWRTTKFRTEGRQQIEGRAAALSHPQIGSDHV